MIPVGRGHCKKGVKRSEPQADAPGMGPVRQILVLGLLVLASGCQSPPRDPGDMARTYLEAGRYDDAVREIGIAVRARPRDPALRIEAARISAEAGDVEHAVQHLEVALSIAPRDPEISILLGELERDRDNLPDAYVAFRRAAELAPDDVRAISGLALSAEALGFEREANDAYAQWSRLEKDAPAY
jgi:Flp pilus assembly protein TadD